MFNILIVILGLGLLIGLHELSHMLMGKLFGIKSLKFSFGFGPKLLGFVYGGTSYELRLLPLGGFVQFSGESPSSKTKNGFFGASWWKRSLTALAGPVTNLLLGLAIIFVLLLTKHWPFMAAVHRTFTLSWFIISTTLKGIAGLFSSSNGNAASGLAGPIMVTKIMVNSLKESFSQFCLILSVISLSLGLFNLFPIPGLDGGHVFLYILEGLRRKRFSDKVYMVWSYIGMVLLISLMSYVIFGDIVKLFHK